MQVDQAVQTFLGLKRIAVAGVSRGGDSPANAIAKRLRETEHEVFAVNPNAEEVDGHACFSSVDAIPGGVEGVVVVTRPEQAKDVALEAARAGADWIWFHQGFGPVSFDDDTIRVAREQSLHVIAAGCPMMYCCPDGFHRCARAVFEFFGRIPKDIDTA